MKKDRSSKFNRIALAVAVVIACAGAAAQQTTATQQTRTVESSSSQERSAADKFGLNANDILTADLWGLTHEEMARAKALLQGPRKAFSVENLSPIEALGIHARNDAERRKYAEMMVRIFKRDVDQSLKWNEEFTAAMARLYPNMQVVDYSKVPKVETSVGAADALNVPRSSIIEKPGPGYTPLPTAPSRK